MKPKKSDIKGANIDFDLPNGVIWEDVVKLLKEKKNQQLLSKIDPETFKFVLKIENHQKLIHVLLKTLRKTNPDNATLEYGEKLVEIMKNVAKTNLLK